MAVRIPAYCPSCGAIFPAPVALGPGAKVTFTNVSTNCPFCGGTAMLDGEFRGAEGAIEIIRSKAITAERLKIFASLIREAYERKITFEETKKRATDIDPQLGEAVDEIHKQGGGIWSASLLLLVLALSRCNFDYRISLDINDLAKTMLNRSPAAITELIPLPKPDPRSPYAKK
jgi:hypothetical protein